MVSNFEWEQTYQQALLELDQSRLEERISLAEQAVRTRLGQLQNPNGVSGSRHEVSGSRRQLVELHKLEDALFALQCLRRTTPGQSK